MQADTTVKTRSSTELAPFATRPNYCKSELLSLVYLRRWEP